MRTQPIHTSGNTASSGRKVREAGKAPQGELSAVHANDGGHVSVLSDECLVSLAILPTDIVVDATLGGAGHAKRMASLLGKDGVFVGFDLDDAAIGRANVALAAALPRVILHRADFRTMRDALQADGLMPTKVLFDLGWSSYQLAGRGLSFTADETLDMRYGTGPLTARAIVNSWAESSLADVIFGWGGERYSRRIARAIVSAREKKPIETARELGEIVRKAVPAVARHGKTHPATKTFQALRIAVNDELGALKEALVSLWQILAPGGRIAIITFHSLEDRIVKEQFAAWERAGEGSRLTKKPIIPTREETTRNPRARSAKLRTIQKL